MKKAEFDHGSLREVFRFGTYSFNLHIRALSVLRAERRGR